MVNSPRQSLGDIVKRSAQRHALILGTSLEEAEELVIKEIIEFCSEFGFLSPDMIENLRQNHAKYFDAAPESSDLKVEAGVSV